MSKYGRGSSLIELLIAMGIFVLIVSAIAFLIIDAYVSDRLGKELTQATFLAEEGLEVARDTGFASVASIAPEVIDKFTRTITVTTIDVDRKQITSQVDWDLTDLRSEEVILNTYFTNWEAGTGGGGGTCSSYCQSLGYPDGTCRQGVGQCNQNGETSESGGNSFCTVQAAGACCCSSVPPPADTTAPADISDLALSGATNSSIDLDWTAPGDDGSTGTATSYDIRYSTATITLANWGSATQATGEPTPSVAGSGESMTVSGLSASTLYYFAMKTSDEVPNESGLSNVPSLTTTSAPITTCSAYCIANSFSTGTCRQNSGKCSQNGETYAPAGDTYCTGGPSADTCCCLP